MLFGITTHEPDYKISFKLNQALQLELCREESIELKNKKQNDNLLFSLFCYVDDMEQLEYNLVSNKSYNTVGPAIKPKNNNQEDLFGDLEPEVTGQKGFLVSELNNKDFLFIVRCPYDPEFAYEMEQKIKSIEGVLNVQYLDVNDLQSKENLLF